VRGLEPVRAQALGPVRAQELVAERAQEPVLVPEPVRAAGRRWRRHNLWPQ